MHIYYLAAAAANCRSGTWAQRWTCGWNEPAAGTGHAGYVFGHDVLPALLALAAVLLVAMAARKRKSRSRPAAAGTRARAGAGRW